MEEYNDVMKFAFTSMTKNDDAALIGQVYGIEVVPWVHNSAFQVAAKLQDENIELPMPRSLMPKAIHDTTPGTGWILANRGDYSCKDSSFVIDKYGYCCEAEQLFDYENDTYDEDETQVNDRICKPIRSLDKALVKDNMSNNGEFVARLDATMRYKMTQLAATERCISAANAIPDRYEYYLLKPNDGVKYDRAISIPFTLVDLKRTLNPFGDYSIISHMANEMDEWIEMFYTPCYASLYGMNVGTTPDVDVSYFMAYPWYTHDACMKLSCLSNNMRWDREDGGCIPGLITGSNAPGYDGVVTECASDIESDAATEECKHDEDDLDDYHSAITTCWSNQDSVGTVGIDFFTTHFCNPQLTGEQLTGQDLTDKQTYSCTPPSRRRRLQADETNETTTTAAEATTATSTNENRKTFDIVEEEHDDFGPEGFVGETPINPEEFLDEEEEEEADIINLKKKFITSANKRELEEEDE